MFGVLYTLSKEKAPENKARPNEHRALAYGRCLPATSTELFLCVPASESGGGGVRSGVRPATPFYDAFHLGVAYESQQHLLALVLTISGSARPFPSVAALGLRSDLPVLCDPTYSCLDLLTQRSHAVLQLEIPITGQGYNVRNPSVSLAANNNIMPWRVSAA